MISPGCRAIFSGLIGFGTGVVGMVDGLQAPLAGSRTSPVGQVASAGPAGAVGAETAAATSGAAESAKTKPPASSRRRAAEVAGAPAVAVLPEVSVLPEVAVLPEVWGAMGVLSAGVGRALAAGHTVNRRR